MVGNYKTKENGVVMYIQEKFPNVDWRSNKEVEGGCSKREGLTFSLGYGKSHRYC